MKIIYIAGKITGDPSYRAKFAKAHHAVLQAGHIPLVPSFLPDDMDYEHCMTRCFEMIDRCDALVTLDDWRDSKGAMREVEYARSRGLAVLPEAWLYNKEDDKA